MFVEVFLNSKVIAKKMMKAMRGCVGCGWVRGVPQRKPKTDAHVRECTCALVRLSWALY
jgi:hypothetical protein